MSSDVVKYGFTAGEISPTLFGRSDLTRYDFGMAEAHNFFVDYRGGLSSRPGFEFCDVVKGEATRLVKFSFSPDIENTYVLLFGDGYIRFLQDGGYVLEGSLPLTAISNGNPAMVTSAGHGLVDGQWIKLANVAGMPEVEGRTFIVAGVTADTFTLRDVIGGGYVDSTGYSAHTGGGSIRAIYELESPYAAADLAGLSFDQYRDYLRITTKDFPPHDLVRTDHANWTLSETVISPYAEGPEITGFSSSTPTSPDTNEDAQAIFAVTAVFADGTESSIGTPFKVMNVVNYPVTEGSVSIMWEPVPDALEYKVYRSIVSVQEVLSYGSELGYAGRTRGTKFTDPNIIVDFGKTPPNNYNPFAPGAITSVRVLDGGTGYSHTSTLTMAGGGTGFDGQVITDDAGVIVNIIVKSGGEGYVNPTLTIDGGTGATTAVTARSLTGTYPALSGIFQQRQIYAASEIKPITVWGSQYKRFDNFNSTDFVLDSDAFEFDLDTAAIAPIKHLLVARGGMLLMTQDNVWILAGGGSGEPLTPTNALADPQTYTGVSGLRPIPIDTDVLYTEGKGYAVRLLAYNELSKVYSGDDKSILSNHLFGRDKHITHWGFQESPFKTVWCVREDGALLAFTIVKAEEVFAWTPGATKGRFRDLVVVREITEDRVYVVTERIVGGTTVRFVERMDLRTFVNVEDAWCVDAGLALSGTTPVGSVVAHENGEGWLADITGGSFAGSVGKMLRAANGVFRVMEELSANTVRLDVWVDPTDLMPESATRRTWPQATGTWTLDAPSRTIRGLWHLEGEEVAVLGDGNVFPRQTVVDGAITLPTAVSRAIVGLPYTCRAKTLPMIVPDAGIESKRKRVPGLAVRLTRSRGLKYGNSYDRVYEMKERTGEGWGKPTAMQEGISYRHIGTRWEEEGQTCFLLEDPLPVTVLSIISDIEVGDEPD